MSIMVRNYDFFYTNAVDIYHFLIRELGLKQLQEEEWNEWVLKTICRCES